MWDSWGAWSSVYLIALRDSQISSRVWSRESSGEGVDGGGAARFCHHEGTQSKTQAGHRHRHSRLERSARFTR
jgi:hypothetical protein